MAVYSGTPLIEKLGIKNSNTIIIINPPAGYSDSLQLPENVTVMKELRGMFDFIQCFSVAKEDLQQQIQKLSKHLVRNGMLWVSWPKKSAKTDPDLDENIVRAIGLTAGLVDVKVVAIDDVWSGLKFVYRLKDR